MLINLNEEQVRELASNLQKLSQRESEIMSGCINNTDAAFHNGRSGAFHDAAGILLMALVLERNRKIQEN